VTDGKEARVTDEQAVAIVAAEKVKMVDGLIDKLLDIYASAEDLADDAFRGGHRGASQKIKAFQDDIQRRIGDLDEFRGDLCEAANGRIKKF
jgi:hypothetical protein